VHEMKSYVAQADVEQWEPLVEWLEKPGGNRAPATQSPPPAEEPPPTTAIASV